MSTVKNEGAHFYVYPDATAAAKGDVFANVAALVGDYRSVMQATHEMSDPKDVVVCMFEMQHRLETCIRMMCARYNVDRNALHRQVVKTFKDLGEYPADFNLADWTREVEA